MARNKDQGPDGFTAEFYRSAWDTVGPEVTSAVNEFFTEGRMFREPNTTINTLVPKKKQANCIGDFIPISCFNVFYKCISKIFAERMKSVSLT
ncbi:hypothetical protein MLD38_020947 [Melastoma candidum]|uniref:Uncharacterized protein n=1 Tax=Melastoma candidum TaxID=119954 RepID=A0ACB9QEM3_9MYRT|nr:hypothetical protein MLD38_020947 [Melastoma candidum]